jgi:hypothetical protein
MEAPGYLQSHLGRVDDELGRARHVKRAGRLVCEALARTARHIAGLHESVPLNADQRQTRVRERSAFQDRESARTDRIRVVKALPRKADNQPGKPGV